MSDRCQNTHSANQQIHQSIKLTKNPSFTENRPRTNLETWKSKLPAETWKHLVRARGAHLNSMEVFPLFAAAMVSFYTC